MPTYDFRCPTGHKFTHFYKTISAAQSQLPCPECGATAERQLSGGAGFAFKGSGFYLTDYGKNAHRGGEKPSSKAESSNSSGGSEKATDSAPSGSAPAKAESAKPQTPSAKPEGKSQAPGAKPK